MLLRKNNNAAKYIVFLKQNNSEDFIGALYTSLFFFSWKVDFLSFKKSPNINLYAEYSRT